MKWKNPLRRIENRFYCCCNTKFHFQRDQAGFIFIFSTDSILEFNENNNSPGNSLARIGKYKYVKNTRLHFTERVRDIVQFNRHHSVIRILALASVRRTSHLMKYHRNHQILQKLQNTTETTIYPAVRTENSSCVSERKCSVVQTICIVLEQYCKSSKICFGTVEQTAEQTA